MAQQEVLGRRQNSEPVAQQTEGRDRPSRSPGHAEKGGDLSKHGGRIPVRPCASTQTGALLSRRLHLQEG